MSKLEELIEELCPNGVEYKSLGELGNFYGGLSGKNKEDFVNGNTRFITYMNVFSNIEINNLVEDKVNINQNEKQNKIEYGDVLFTGSSETIEECGMSCVITYKTEEILYLNSFCFCFRFCNNFFIPQFSKYLFRIENIRKQIIATASGVTRFNVSKKKMEKVIIPVPPLEVQREIVRILDNFTELQAELQAELQKRKIQYEYYRDSLLTFSDNVEWKTLGEISEINTGNCNTCDAIIDGRYAFYVRSDNILRINDYEFDEESVVTSGDGVGVGKIIHYVNGKYNLHQRAYRIVTNKKFLKTKFLYYYMKNSFYDYILKSCVSSSVTSIRKPMLLNYLIPVPPLEEQQRIVDILDRFYKLCNDISEGLPAEIEARKKQYEYYRDKLLTFKKAE